MSAMDEEESQTSPKPATFKGLLSLKDFAYQGDQNAPRRSPRNVKISSRPETDTSVAPDTTSLKRKATSGPRRAEKPRESSSGPSEDDQQDYTNTNTNTKKEKKKRQRPGSSYAPPSTYAHLSLLPDAIAANLLVLFIGLNPGIQTARSGHAYCHPSNLFWKLLFSSGITPRRCAPEEDGQMPRLYSLGLTNIVSRPSRNGGELSKSEMDDGVAALEDKAREWRPESICIVGKSIWESIWRVRHGGKAVGKAFKYGWQDETENMGVIEGEWAGARVFVATSTSGLAASLSPAEKLAIWSELGTWVKERRLERDAHIQESDAI